MPAPRTLLILQGRTQHHVVMCHISISPASADPMFAVTPFHKLYGSSPLSHLLSAWLELGLEEHLEQTGHTPVLEPSRMVFRVSAECQNTVGSWFSPLEGHF